MTINLSIDPNEKWFFFAFHFLKMYFSNIIDFQIENFASTDVYIQASYEYEKHVLRSFSAGRWELGRK